MKDHEVIQRSFKNIFNFCQPKPVFSNLFYFCTQWRTTEYVSTLVLYCYLILKSFLVYYWRLRYPWKLSELSFLALSYCIWSAIFMLVLARPVVSLSMIEYISLCHSFCVEGKPLSQIIFRLRSFRFFAVDFGKNLQTKDEIESTSDLKRMPAFRGIWCLINLLTWNMSHLFWGFIQLLIIIRVPAYLITKVSGTIWCCVHRVFLNK